eukprot:871409-Pyramimonas_sp.AAC.1
MHAGPPLCRIPGAANLPAEWPFAGQDRGARQLRLRWIERRAPLEPCDDRSDRKCCELRPKSSSTSARAIST